jgi:hypothetical protein
MSGGGNLGFMMASTDFDVGFDKHAILLDDFDLLEAGLVSRGSCLVSIRMEHPTISIQLEPTTVDGILYCTYGCPSFAIDQVTSSRYN